jgi:tetratricopeptide (TPR) repeat protein
LVVSGVGPVAEPADVPPVDPGRARTIDDLVELLRSLKVWAGDPSYEKIKDRVNVAWAAAGLPSGELTKKSTVVDCFRTGRRRLNSDLVLAVVEALHPDIGYVAQWRQALRVVSGEVKAVSQVRVQDGLPQDLATFTGRTAELQRLCRLLGDAAQGGTVVISAVEGMAGVGKTQLAVRIGHLLDEEKRFDRVLFVNLRGFHPDPAQPPADPAAVLDGFLRLLGVPAQQIPHDLDARTRVYRARLAETRSLVILDNAASTDQIRPLLTETAGCPVMVTSRHRLHDLDCAVHLALDVFTAQEALDFLVQATPGAAVGEDPAAAARITERCGYLPLALGLIAGHIRNKPDWTLTDHADWLDDRRRHRRLDTGVEVAFGLSYNDLPVERRRLLRLLALHPAQDFDAYAAAALAGIDPATARTELDRLRDEHLLQQATSGRYAFHDLVRAYATTRVHDEDRSTERRTALTRLFDYYLAATAAAMNTLFPAQAGQRPTIPPPDTPTPNLTDPDAAREWLDVERPTLVAVTAHTATHGWPSHATRLSRILFHYLVGGYGADALTVHNHAHDAASHNGDPAERAYALTDLGGAHFGLGRFGAAHQYLRLALDLFRQVGDRAGEARAVGNLAIVAERTGDYATAIDRYGQALDLYRQLGERPGEARALSNLGSLEARAGRHRVAVEYHEQALTLHRAAGDRSGEAATLLDLGDVEGRLGRHGPANDHFRRAMDVFRQLGDPIGEAWALYGIGTLHTRRDRHAEATEYHERALSIFRRTGNRTGEANALNGLGEAAHTAGNTSAALAHHNAAHTAATDTEDSEQQARAHTGLGDAHRTLDDPAVARHHYQQALTLYTDLGLPETEQVRSRLDALSAGSDGFGHG